MLSHSKYGIVADDGYMSFGVRSWTGKTAFRVVRKGRFTVKPMVVAGFARGFHGEPMAFTRKLMRFGAAGVSLIVNLSRSAA